MTVTRPALFDPVLIGRIVLKYYDCVRIVTPAWHFKADLAGVGKIQTSKLLIFISNGKGRCVCNRLRVISPSNEVV
jgi:hypothetical protein